MPHSQELTTRKHNADVKAAHKSVIPTWTTFLLHFSVCEVVYISTSEFSGSQH